MISLFGFFTDWLITRDWRRTLLLLLLPLSVLLFVAISGVLGAIQNREALAQRYLSIGEAELAELGEDWAYEMKVDAGVQTESSAPTEAETKISRFTEAVFKRAQQLDGGSQRIRFVIGAMLGRQGLIGNATAVMKSLAPEDRTGYLPAHAWLASLLRATSKPNVSNPSLTHHMNVCRNWEGVPASLLISEASRRVAVGDQDSLEIARQAAEKDTQYEGVLLRIAIKQGNVLAADQAAEKMSKRLEPKFKDGSATAQELIDLAEAYYYDKRPDDAVKVLEAARKDPRLAADLPKILRTLSELFRIRFVSTLQISASGFSADMGLLDTAMRYDPNNPSIAEEVAKLARIGGDNVKPSDALIAKLNEFLAEGKATPITRAWIAETYLLRDEWDKAIEQWQLMLLREPNYAQAHNNLAYALAQRYPERMSEALEHAQKAVAIAPTDANSRDTLAYIYFKLNRLTEAIAEAELSIELKPDEIEFHKRAAEIHVASNNTVAAKAQMDVVKRLEALKAAKP